MRKLLLILPVLALCWMMPGAYAESLSLEGKATLTAASGAEPATFVVEGTEFQMQGDPVASFVQQHGPGQYIVLVDGDYDLDRRTVQVTRMMLVKKLRG